MSTWSEQRTELYFAYQAGVRRGFAAGMLVALVITLMFGFIIVQLIG